MFIESPDDANTDFFLKIVEDQMNFLKYLKLNEADPKMLQICKDTIDTLYLVYELKRPDHHMLCSTAIH